MSTKRNQIINQEYLRQIVKRLVWLSDYLASELDMKSENYSETHIAFLEGRIKEIYVLAPKARSQKELGILMSMTYVDPWLYRQLNMAELIKTDPFLPKNIRTKVSEMYIDRVNQMGTAYGNVIEKYCKDLYEGKLKDSYEKVEMKVRATIGTEYREVGWGWEDAQIKIAQRRGEIEKYLIALK